MIKEILDIVDLHGEPTGETVERETAHAEGIWHRTAHLWLVRKRNDKFEILLQKRCQTKDAYPGCYDISSAGHIPAGVDYLASAVRELKEELGLSAEETDLVYCGDRKVIADDCFHGIPYHDRQYSRVYFMWFDGETDEITVQPEEVESVRWMDLDECIAGVEADSFRNCIAMEELMILKNALERARKA